MVFKKMLGALGVGGPSVDTVLSDPNTRPGLVLEGQMNLVGGNQDVTLERITVGLVTRVEMEVGDSEHQGQMEFHRVEVAGGRRLREGEELSLPLRVPVPWETPITDVYGRRLHGMTMGLRTELAVAGAIDKSDLDPVYVHPLPMQERVLAAFGELGFRFKGADLEMGRVRGANQSLPFYQEIAFVPPQRYARVNEVELTFITGPEMVEVVLEVDKRSGGFTGGGDSVASYRVAHADADTTDWTGQVDAWVSQTIERRSHRGSSGSGMGGLVAGALGGAALGVAAGMVAEEVFDSLGDDSFEFGED